MNYTIALSDELLLDFYNFKHNKKYKNSNIQALFNYYKTPHITNIAQLKRIGITDSILLAQLVKKNLTHQTLLELCDKSIFKIILDSSKSDYPYVNIYGDTLENNYSATFYRGELRTKAQEHIKSLLKDAKNISAPGLKSKAQELLDVIKENPYQTSPPYEKLVGDLTGAYSRRI